MSEHILAAQSCCLLSYLKLDEYVVHGIHTPVEQNCSTLVISSRLKKQHIVDVQLDIRQCPGRYAESVLANHVGHVNA
jgi:hypothetical protein